MILSVRLLAAILTILAAALSLIGVLNYFKFDSTLTAMQNSRVEVVGYDVKSAIQAATDLGLRLKDTSDAQTVIERAISEEPILAGISVFDREGQVLFQATAQNKGPVALPGGQVQPAWLLDNLKAAKAWQTTTGHSFVVGLPLETPFGLVIGGIALQYDKEQHWSVLQAMRNELLLAGGVIFLAFAVIAAIVVHRLFRRLISDARRVDKQLTQLLGTLSRPDALRELGEEPETEPEEDTTMFGDGFKRFRRRTVKTVVALEEAERAMERL